MSHEKDTTKADRRTLLRHGGLIGLGVFGLAAVGTRGEGACNDPTPTQTEGPYYPVRHRDDEDYDLTRVKGRTGVAAGEAMVVGGVVRDESCKPLADALVEIWQADARGRYDHPGDAKSSSLDPNFQYWGRVRTGVDGTYSFKTVRPGLYTGRTRHIHFRVIALQYPTLTTQLYFAGEPRNASDGLYLGLSSARRSLVTTTLAVDPATGILSGRFDITLGRGARRTPALD